MKNDLASWLGFCSGSGYMDKYPLWFVDWFNTIKYDMRLLNWEFDELSFKGWRFSLFWVLLLFLLLQLAHFAYYHVITKRIYLFRFFKFLYCPFYFFLLWLVLYFHFSWVLEIPFKRFRLVSWFLMLRLGWGCRRWVVSLLNFVNYNFMLFKLRVHPFVSQPMMFGWRP